MSKLQVDDIVNKDDTGSVGFSRGAVVTGVATATSFSGPLTGNAILVHPEVVLVMLQLQQKHQRQVLLNLVVH